MANKRELKKQLRLNGLFLKNIPYETQTEEMCSIAIKQNPYSIEFADPKKISKELCQRAVELQPDIIKFIPNRFINQDMIWNIITENIALLKYAPNKVFTNKFILRLISNNIETVDFVPKEKIYTFIRDVATVVDIKRILDFDAWYLRFLPLNTDTIEICLYYLKNSIYNSKYLSDELKSTEQILNYQKSQNKVNFIEKRFDNQKKIFFITLDVLYNELSDNTFDCKYTLELNFDDFDRFYYFLDGNLSGANLLDFDFSNIDLTNYNIDGAIIKSEILIKQGLYNDTYYNSLKYGLAQEDIENEKKFLIKLLIEILMKFA